MKLYKILFCLLFLLSCQHKTPTEPNGKNQLPQWAMFRHGVRHTGNVSNDPYEDIVGPSGDTVSVKWTFNSGGNFVGSPAIDKDGVIYFGTDESADRGFFAVNPDGTLKWKFSPFERNWSSPAIGTDGTIYSISLFGGTLYAFNTAGALKWKLDIGGEPVSSPAVGPDGTLYFCNFRYLNAISPDGMLKWQLGGGDSFHHPVVGLDGTIYYNYYDKGTLIAVNPDGSMKWEYADSSKIIFDSAVIGGDGSIYFLSGNKLYAVDNDSRFKWKIRIPGLINGINVPAIAPNHTLFVVDNQFLLAISPDGKELWRRPAGWVSSPPVVDAAGNVYLSHNGVVPEVITCYSNTGFLKWQIRESLRGTITGGTPLGPGGRLFFGFYGGGDHNLYAIQ